MNELVARLRALIGAYERSTMVPYMMDENDVQPIREAADAIERLEEANEQEHEFRLQAQEDACHLSGTVARLEDTLARLRGQSRAEVQAALKGEA